MHLLNHLYEISLRLFYLNVQFDVLSLYMRIHHMVVHPRFPYSNRFELHFDYEALHLFLQDRIQRSYPSQNVQYH